MFSFKKKTDEAKEENVVSLEFEEKELRNKKFASAETRFNLTGSNFPLARQGKSALGTTIVLFLFGFGLNLLIETLNRFFPQFKDYPFYVVYILFYGLSCIFFLYYLILYYLRSSKYWERNVLRNDLKERGKTGRILSKYGYAQKLEKAIKDKNKDLEKALRLIAGGKLYIFTRQKPQAVGRSRVITYYSFEVRDTDEIDVQEAMLKELESFPNRLYMLFNKQVVFDSVISRTDNETTHLQFLWGEVAKVEYDKWDWEEEWIDLYNWRTSYELEHSFPYRANGKYKGLSNPKEINESRRESAISWANTQIDSVKRALQAEGYQTNEITTRADNRSAVYRATIASQLEKVNKDAGKKLAEAVKNEMSNIDNEVQGITAEVSIREIRVIVPLPNGAKKGQQTKSKIPYVDTSVPDYTLLVDKEQILREVFG